MELLVKGNTRNSHPTDAQTAPTRSREVRLSREKLIPIFESMFVLSLQLVFRATLIARHLNY
jgi:hypothetical protein